MKKKPRIPKEPWIPRGDAIAVAEEYLQLKYNISQEAYGAYFIADGRKLTFSKGRPTWEVYFESHSDLFHDFTICVDDLTAVAWDSVSGTRKQL